jgi:hypothetical protein
VLDAIEALPQRGVFFFQGIETRYDRVLIACSCCVAIPWSATRVTAPQATRLNFMSTSCLIIKLAND